MVLQVCRILSLSYTDLDLLNIPHPSGSKRKTPPPRRRRLFLLGTGYRLAFSCGWFVGCVNRRGLVSRAGSLCGRPQRSRSRSSALSDRLRTDRLVLAYRISAVWAGERLRNRKWRRSITCWMREMRRRMASCDFGIAPPDKCLQWGKNAQSADWFPDEILDPN